MANSFGAATVAILVVLTADKAPAPTQVEGGEPPVGTPALRRLISDWHRSVEDLSDELIRVVHECAEDRALSEAEVDMLVHLSDVKIERHLVNEERAFLPLMRLCLAGGDGDPVDFILDRHQAVHHDVQDLKSAAKAWKGFGDRRANRLHFARAADALARDLRSHIVAYLWLLMVADDCLSDANWTAGFQKLDFDFQHVAAPAKVRD